MTQIDKSNGKRVTADSSFNDEEDTINDDEKFS